MSKVKLHLQVCVAIVALGACTSPKRTIRIPESVVPNPKKDPAKQKQTMEPYIIRVADGRRTIEVQIPPQAFTGSFSTTIPFHKLDDANTDGLPQTEADREIIDAKKAAGEPTPREERGKPPKTRSYLQTLARVNDLFKRRQYELALIELTKLDREYPDDERILEMKGTLHWKLRRPKQARESWERVLALNPNNTAVAQALEQLDQGGE